MQEECAQLPEVPERKSWWECCEFVIGEINLDESREVSNKVEVFKGGPALAEDKHLHLLGLLDSLQLAALSGT